MTNRSHESLLKPGQTLVCIGDGITREPEGYVRTVRDVLALRFPDDPLQVINAGVDGNTAEQMLARFDRDVLAHEPDWVSIMAGAAAGNRQFQGRHRATAPEQFGQALEEMIAQARAADVRVALCTPPYLGQYCGAADAAAVNRNLAAKTEWLRERGKQSDVLLVPTHEVVLRLQQPQSPQVASADFYPVEVAYALMALAFLAAFGYDLDLQQLQ